MTAHVCYLKTSKIVHTVQTWYKWILQQNPFLSVFYSNKEILCYVSVLPSPDKHWL